MPILNELRDFQWAMKRLPKKRKKGRLVNDWEKAEQRGIIKKGPVPSFEECKNTPTDDLNYHSKRLWYAKHTPLRDWEFLDGLSTLGDNERFSIKRENELVNDVMYLILSEGQTKGIRKGIYKKYGLEKETLEKIIGIVREEFCYPELIQYKDTTRECFRPSWLDLEKVKRAEKKSRSKDITGKEYKKKFGYYPSGVVKKKPKELASRTYHNQGDRLPVRPVLPL